MIAVDVSCRLDNNKLQHTLVMCHERRDDGIALVEPEGRQHRDTLSLLLLAIAKKRTTMDGCAS